LLPLTWAMAWKRRAGGETLWSSGYHSCAVAVVANATSRVGSSGDSKRLIIGVSMQVCGYTLLGDVRVVEVPRTFDSCSLVRRLLLRDAQVIRDFPDT